MCGLVSVLFKTSLKSIIATTAGITLGANKRELLPLI